MVGTEKLILGAVALIVAAMVINWLRKNEEGYNNQPLSRMNYMLRTPVTYAFQGDGMSGNPHYRADPTDKLVPLEYGGQDFWNPGAHKYPPPVRKATELVNDGKTRLDLVEAGDIGWFRYLSNLPVTNAPMVGNSHYEYEEAEIDPAQPLYDPSYHYDDILGN